MKQATSVRKIQSGTVNSHMVNHPSLLSLINQSKLGLSKSRNGSLKKWFVVRPPDVLLVQLASVELGFDREAAA